MRLVDKLSTGDVVYASCVDVPLCYHIGIVYGEGKNKKVFHNTPYVKNKYGGSVCSESWETFIKGREVLNIVRTNITQKRILEASRKCKREVWSELFFNCEDYVLEVVEGHRRSTIRDAYKISALGVAIISLL
jgi:hypothetical protein